MVPHLLRLTLVAKDGRSPTAINSGSKTKNNCSHIFERIQMEEEKRGREEIEAEVAV